MATTTLSVSNGNRGKIYTLTYSVSSTSTATTVTLTSLKVGNSSWAGSPIIIRFYADSTSTQITSITDDGWAVDSTHTINKTYSWNKAESAQTKHVLVYGKQSANGSESTIGTTDIEVSVPALAKYAVTYNANGGSGAPATQYKVYGKNLTLSTVKPTRSGFSFVKWFTKADGTGTGYNPGATYSTNAALNLYAKWSAIPSVTSLKVIRSDGNGDQDDSGTYAAVTATWTMESSTSESATVTGTITPQGGTSSAITLSGTTTGTGGTVTALVPNMDTDTQYVVAITAANGSNTATRSAVLTRAFFIMDFKAGGGGIGIGRAAPSDSLAVGYNAEFDGNVDIFGPTNIDSTLDTTGKITSQHNIQAQCYLILRANADNFSAIRTIPKAGATGRTGDAIRFYGVEGSSDGDEIVIGNGGQTIVGGGESGINLHTALAQGSGTERLYLASDTSVHIVPNCQTIANRRDFEVRAAGIMTPSFSGVNYIDGGKGNAALYVRKNTGSVWYPAVTLDTTSGGSWSIGNYNNENLQFSWASKANRDSSTNSTTIVNLPNTAGTIALKPTQLYNNASGSNGTITLSATAANYNHMRIYYRNASGQGNHVNQYNATEVFSPNGKYVNLAVVGPDNTSDLISMNTRLALISGTTINNARSASGNLSSSGSSAGAYNEVYIVRVEAWND